MTDCHVSNKLRRQEDCKPVVYDMQMGLVKTDLTLDQYSEMPDKMIA